MRKERKLPDPWNYLTSDSAWYLSKPSVILCPPSLLKMAKQILNGEGIVPEREKSLEEIVDKIITRMGGLMGLTVAEFK